MGLFDGLLRRSPEDRRRRLLASLPEGPVRDHLQTPAPAGATPVEELRLLAIDVETTGLRPEQDRLLSIGFVPVDGTTIDLSGARHLLVRQTGEVGESATIHGLTDDQLSQGLPLADALAQTLEALRGRVLLAHYTGMEESFLATALQRAFGLGPEADGGTLFSSVDTMHLQYRLLTTGFDDEPPKNALRLWGARQRYGLPVYKAHEALTDALACAELYLALVAESGTGRTLAELQR